MDVSSCGSTSSSRTSPGPAPTSEAATRSAGPSEWIVEQLAEYVEAGANGFVVNLDYDADGLEERIRRFGKEVAPRLRG